MYRSFVVQNIAASLLIILCSMSGFAQDSATTPTVEAPPGVTRADLSVAYLRLERSYFENLPTDPDRVIEINKAFDAATRNFFSGKFAETIAEINQLTASLLPAQSSAVLIAAMALKPTIDPLVVPLDKPTVIRIDLSSMFPIPIPSGASLQLSLRPIVGGDAVLTKPFSIERDSTGNVIAQLEIEPAAALTAGAYSVLVSSDKVPGVEIGQLNVVPRSLDAIRAENTQRLAAIATDQPELSSPIAATRSRNALLQDQPSSGNSSQFLTDLNALAGQVAEEIDQLSGGQDPFRRRAGDYWRTFAADDKDKPVPARVYAPESVIGDQPVPLVVVLHGAGGDENMFFAGYGAGRIKTLADKHGFLVASPATAIIGGRSERFDALVAQLSSDYAIDSKAIYLLGHSMGGFTTVSLASKRSDRLAAVCCLAGGGNPGAKSVPPMLIIGAELDAIVPNGVLKLGAQQAIEAGLPVEYRVQENYGHTLMVGAVLDEAVDWLLKHRLDDGGPGQ